MQDPLAARLQALRDIASLVNAGNDPQTILQRIMDAVCRHTAWSSGGIMRVDLGSGFSELLARHDPGPNEGLATRWDLATSPALRVAAGSAPLIIADAQQSVEFPGYRADAEARGYHTTVILPIAATDAAGNRMVMSVQARRVVDVDPAELDFLTTIAHLGAIAVEKAKRLDAERRQSERLRQVLALNQSLLARALAGDSLPTLLTLIEALLPDPLIVIDAVGGAILVCRSPVPATMTEAEWRRFVQRKAARLLLDQTRSEGQQIDFTAAGLELRLPAVIEPMTIDGEPAGALVVFPGQSPPDPLVIQEARLALNVHLLRDFVRVSVRLDSARELIAALIGGAPLGESAVLLRARQLGVDLTQPACLAAVGVPTGADPAGFRQLLGLRIEAWWPGAVLADIEGTLAVLLPRTGEAARLWRAVRRLALDLGTPPVALGPVCQVLAEYPPAWQACLRLLALGRRTGQRGVLDPAAFGPLAGLLSDVAGEAAGDFFLRVLGGAAAYDRRHGTKLVETAVRFAEGGGRFQPCADALGIHVSTLRYRIERFEALTRTDLADPEARFTVSLAARLRPLISDGS